VAATTRLVSRRAMSVRNQTHAVSADYVSARMDISDVTTYAVRIPLFSNHIR